MERAEAEAVLGGDREAAVALLMRVGELVEARRRLEARVAELEQRLNRGSRNSSLLPFRDPPAARPRPRRPGSGRARGGQLGHEGKSRPLLPFAQVDEVREHWPECCRVCAHVFGEEERVDAALAQRHQVSELPPIAVTVTEHRLHRLRCPACAAETRAELPAEVARGAFGPRLQAAVATLAVRNRVSRRDTVELVRELFGAALSTGAVEAIVQRAGEALAEPQARLHDHIRSASALNVDETGWRLRGGKRTLWGGAQRAGGALPDRPRPPRARGRGAARRGLRRYRLHRSLLGLRLPRARAAPALLGAPGQGLHRPQRGARSPRGSSAQPASRVRPSRARDRRTPVRGLGRVPRERRPRPPARTDRPLKQELRALLEQAARKSTKTNYHRLFANNLLKRWPALSTSTLSDGVEPTNNHAERGLRGPVINRKLSLGNQSEQGERTIRAAAPHLAHPPPTAAHALRLPHRRPQRQHPRRSHPRAHLTLARHPRATPECHEGGPPRRRGQWAFGDAVRNAEEVP